MTFLLVRSPFDGDLRPASPQLGVSSPVTRAGKCLEMSRQHGFDEDCPGDTLSNEQGRNAIWPCINPCWVIRRNRRVPHKQTFLTTSQEALTDAGTDAREVARRCASGDFSRIDFPALFCIQPGRSRYHGDRPFAQPVSLTTQASPQTGDAKSLPHSE